MRRAGASKLYLPDGESILAITAISLALAVCLESPLGVGTLLEFILVITALDVTSLVVWIVATELLILAALTGNLFAAHGVLNLYLALVFVVSSIAMVAMMATAR